VAVQEGLDSILCLCWLCRKTLHLTAYNVFYDHKFALELAYVQAPVQILNLLYIVHKHGSYIAGLLQLLL
jgi:7-cyano-7-deazaguanine synthase in queuosine biosynthesis